MSQQMTQYLLPLLVIVVVVALRARRLSKKRPLKLGRLWIRPAILLIACAAVLLLPQPGVPVHQFSPMDAVWFGLAILLGAVGGWQLGRTMAIDVHPGDGTLMVQASPVGLIVLIALVVGRTLVRVVAAREGQAWHLDVALIFDALIVFTAALFAVRSLEMYLRAKKVMAAS